jgi:peptidoglycan/xylan/chitin deacetylase (PgdA/CDA1 family)
VFYSRTTLSSGITDLYETYDFKVRRTETGDVVMTWRRSGRRIPRPNPKAHVTGRTAAKAAVLVFLLSLSWCLRAQDNRVLGVLPWNGHKAALSLTFDDGLSAQLDVAVPEMNKRQLRGTFFLVPNNLERLDDWKKLPADGDEIGNHTLTHAHLAELSAEQRTNEVEYGKEYLERAFTAPVRTFAYPYEETTSDVESTVSRYSFMARGSGNLYYMTPDSNVDWYNVSSQVARSSYQFGVYETWIDRDIQLGAWTILQFHGLEGFALGYEPVSVQTFRNVLDYVNGQQSQGLWVAPFGEVGAYFRGQRIFEQAEVTQRRGEFIYDWELPEGFPHGVVLKAKLNGSGRVFRHKKEIIPDGKGVYSIPLDCREIFVVPDKKHE